MATPSYSKRGPSSSKAKAVDLVTGKAKIEYFFDPTLVLPPEAGGDTPFRGGASSTPFKKDLSSSFAAEASADGRLNESKHLFMPCAIVKKLDIDEVTSKTESSEEPALVKTSDGTLHKIRDSKKLVPLTSPEDYLGVDDVLHLPNVTEASLLHTLRLRYKRDDIYTSAGPILMSVNPYKVIANGDLYSERRMLDYRRNGGASHTSPSTLGAVHENKMPPHLFAVADRAYTALIESSMNPLDHALQEEDALLSMEHNDEGGPIIRNQSIIISGESGAGKTEATKIIMQYLARITKKHTVSDPIMSPDGKVMSTLEDRVLSSNPLLESFGNARTLRNDNSSRFGKFIHISFNCNTGGILGCAISNYLLEKTRITTQIEGERNYHIFYQLLSGASEEDARDLGLQKGADSFRYLSNRSSNKVKRDIAGFEETRKCLERIMLTAEDQKVIFGVVAAVLHLGNVEFEETESQEGEDSGHDERAKVKEDTIKSLETACSLLGCDKEAVSDAMLQKLISVGGKTIQTPHTIAQAQDKRDALAKLSYSSLFVWLVDRINKIVGIKDSVDTRARGMSDASDSGATTRPEKPAQKRGFIGVLDIYGFEQFDVNGFEQLLINCANEKLQRYFNRHLFEVEQDLYASEGVDWAYITFNDNKPCLELIEGGGSGIGILNTLDDAWGGVGTAAEKDVKFVSHLHQQFGGVQAMSTSVVKKKGANEGGNKHENFITPKFSNDRQFIVIHYAGEVRYTANGFVEKNVETLSNELKDLGVESSIALVKEVYLCYAKTQPESDTSSVSRRSTIRGISVASQFRSSLQELVADLERTQPHYIRCVKPNLNKSANSFDSSEVLRQLRYSGMMETIRIRREGYAMRESHESFYNRFSILLYPEEVKAGEGIAHLVQVLSARLNVTGVDWQLGHSKIFLRRELSDKLETLAKVRVHAAARTLSRFGRVLAEKRASNLLTSWGRFRLIMLRNYHQKAAASTISAMYRMKKQRRAFRTMRFVTVMVQACARRKHAIAVAEKIRNPYKDMTFKEVKKLHAEEQHRLEEAVASKNYQLAASLEATIVSLTEALEKKRPLTRSMLEADIEDVQKKLEDAVARKAYVECAPLQERLDALAKKRIDLPTIDELKAAIHQAEETQAAAAERRDFSSAAELQAAVDKARGRLEQALADEGLSDTSSSSEPQTDGISENALSSGFSSRADLEVEIVKIQAEVDQKIQKKDFSAASQLHEKLEKLEAIRTELPTIKEMEDQLEKKKSGMDAAIKAKDFGGASAMSDEIEKLEKRILQEREREAHTVTESPDDVCNGREQNIVVYKSTDGEAIVFNTRLELEDEIRSVSEKVSFAAGAKDFKKAKDFQNAVDELEKLRRFLPSVLELEVMIHEEKKSMEASIASKDFEKAEQCHSRIEDLESKLQVEREHAHDKENEDTGGNVSSATTTVEAQPARVVPEVAKSANKIPQTGGGDVADVVPVSKLRPKKPIFCSVSDSAISVAKMLSAKRGDSTIVLGLDGELVGIVTDKDFTTRVVAGLLDPTATSVAKMMTPDPKCVSMTDSGTGAFLTMIENRFRHLPVKDGSGNVVAVLDIAKCLNDVLSKLEKSNEKSSIAAEDAVKQLASIQGGGQAHAEILQQLLGPLLSQALGGKTSITLRKLLAGRPSTIVSPGTNVLDVGRKMAEARKGALVVKEGILVGIFDFKDMMSRVLAKELPLPLTAVSLVMTPEPEHLSPDMTVIEALQFMHDNKFLTLPVCEDDGRCVGLVDVLDLVYASGDSEDWKKLFGSAFDVEDDGSDTCSLHSYRSTARSTTSAKSTKTSKSTISTKKQDDRPVSKLRPKKPLVSGVTDSVLSVAQMLASKRGDASIIVGADGGLAGIITDTDVTRRVVAKDLDPSSTSVSDVMTANPTCVSLSDSAMDALGTMVENHFRHLPVTDDKGSITGVLDIAKCLNDAITKLEKSHEKSSSAAEDAVRQMASIQGGGEAQAAILQQLLGPLMSQAFGGKTSPTLRTLLAGKPATIVSPGTNVLDAGQKMAEARKAALVVDEGRLVGIFGFKDMMTRVVARKLPLQLTAVTSVMTPEPEHVSPDMTVIEALQIMHDNKFLTLPVCEDDVPIGLVDIFDLIYASGGSAGWQSLFDSALDVEGDESETQSDYVGASTSSSFAVAKQPVVQVSATASYVTPVVSRAAVPDQVEIDYISERDSIGDSLTHELQGIQSIFKIVDPNNNTHRLRCEAKLESLLKLLSDKMGSGIEIGTIQVRYQDDEGDSVLITSDECLADAIELARNSGSPAVKLAAEIREEKASTLANTKLLIAAGIGALAAVTVVVLVALKPRK